MMRRPVRRLVAAVALVASTGPFQASLGAVPDAITLQSGDHPGFGRVAVNVGAATTFKLDQVGNRVIVRFADPVHLDQAPSAPRNVVAIKTSGPTIDFIVVPGASIHPTVVAGRVVLDVMDPPAAASAPPVAVSSAAASDKRARQARVPFVPSALIRSPELGGRAPTQSDLRPGPPEPGSASPVAAQPTGGAVQAAVVAQPLPPSAGVPAEPSNERPLEAVQPPPPGRDVMPDIVGPVGLLAHHAKLPKGIEGSAFVLPFGNMVGAAVFQRSGATFAVFDERRPVDMAALQGDPVFGQASVQLLPGGTLLRLPVPGGISIALSQTPQGWRIAGLAAPAKSQSIVATFVAGGVNLAAEQSSDVISMADPDTGATLLVGTTRRPGQAVAVSRRTSEFVLQPTTLGVVVEPLSDAITLKVVPTGFSLAGRAGGLAASPSTSATDALMQAAHLTRRLDFSNMPTEALMRLMSRQVADAAAAEPQARGPKRRALAQSMIALGLATEAASLLNVAVEQDPRQAASADVAGLKAVAALLAGRVADAEGINDPRLTGTDDIALWRAVRQAMQDEGSPGAAAVFANAAPLALLYPKPIGERILPLMIETMIQGGEVASAASLLAQRKTDGRLDYARALERQAKGDTDQALAQLDELAAGHDRFDRARAAVRAVELRLSSRKFTPAQAADALDKLIYVWRGDQRELALRERTAELRGQAGTWRVALSTLRQAESDFPEQAAAVHERLKDAFAGMVAGRGLDQMAPIDVVSAIDENADLMPAKGGSPALEEQLADRLLALDLPDRAKPVLEKLMKSTASATGKARFGATLAALQSRENDDAGALAALGASDGPDLPSDLIEKRALLRANAMAHGGDPAGAAAILAAIGTPATNEARAMILEQAQDWPGAERAWSDLASTALPQAGNLDEAQARTLLRLATAAARAGDDVALATLRGRYDNRIAPGAFAGMFRLLTAEPVRGTGDLKRAKQEVSLAQSLPANLKALGGSSTAR